MNLRYRLRKWLAEQLLPVGDPLQIDLSAATDYDGRAHIAIYHPASDEQVRYIVGRGQGLSTKIVFKGGTNG